MITLAKYITKKTINWYNNENDITTEYTVAKATANLERIYEKYKDSELNQTCPPEENDTVVYKSGQVSVTGDNYITIDGKYYCDKKNAPGNIKDGDKVNYMALKQNKGEDYKVIRIVDIIHKNEVWDDINNDEEWNNTDIFNDEQVLDVEIATRKIIGQISKRENRIIYVEPNGISFNLNDVKCDFIPMVGDYLQMECISAVDPVKNNLDGECLEVVEIRPSRSLKKTGTITSYDEQTEMGKIDNGIVFIKQVCSRGYLPCKKDIVVLECIESSQANANWRALQVYPIVEASKKFEIQEFQKSNNFGNEALLQNKNGIEISDNLNISLRLDEDKDLDVIIQNKGQNDVLLQGCNMRTAKENSQVFLTCPKKNDKITILPSQRVIYTFKCSGRFLGQSSELITFKFSNFIIGRFIKLNVVSGNQNTESLDGGSPNINFDNHVELPVIYEDGMYIRGVKPYKPPKFIVNRPIKYKIPPLLKDLTDDVILTRKTHAEANNLVSENVRSLGNQLMYANYKERFHDLLFLEELAQIHHVKKYSIDTTVLSKRGEYLVLNVPGLVEKRPSLIIGNRAMVSFRWDNNPDKKVYEGCIHKIKSSDVFLKFDPQFQSNYQREDCRVEFKCSVTTLQRCHTAINLVYNNLGESILFPKRVIPKPPQYNFIDENGESDEPRSIDNINESDCHLKWQEQFSKRHIIWYDNKLNIYQQNAVKNILKGIARPLPYIIFGPPGTGKTLTLCESILQISTLFTESRILIATPSNSSANLIAERLLDSGILKPGDLVRIVAWSYLESDNIPEKLIPYCATAEMSSEGSKTNVNLLDERGFKLNCTKTMLGRHKITVGTCAALGILHNMGFPKGHFTHVVIDEAGQATEPELMIPLGLVEAKTGQIVLAGDPLQLGPVVLSRLSSYFGLSDSYLVRLLQTFPYQRDLEGFEGTGYDPRLVTKLLYNYRSLPELLRLPNDLFYDSELIPKISPVNSKEGELLESLRIMLPKRIGCPPALVFHGVDGKNLKDTDSPSWYNEEEAATCVIYLRKLYNHGLEADDIGIITPYDKQVRKIRSLINDSDIALPKVGTVEEFQGQERKVVLLSTVRSKNDLVKQDVQHALGFVSASKRLNVAITRSRSLLIIVGNPFLLQQDCHWRSVIKYCRSKKAYTGCNFEIDCSQDLKLDNDDTDPPEFNI